MPGVIINHAVWQKISEVDPVHLHFLKNDLTIVPKKTQYGKQAIIRLFCYSADKQWVSMPRGYYLNVWRDRTGLEYDEDLRISEGTPLSNTEVIFTPREEDQEPLIQKVVKECTSRNFYSGCIDAYTSFGKSISSLEIIRRLGGNAIILVHTEPLAKQWLSVIEKLWPKAQVGLIQGPKIQFEGKDITVAMVQSLFTNPEKFPKELWRAFHTLIADENHRYGAEKFASVVPRFNVKYALGLSGTQRRLDGCENVFRYVLGKTIAKASEENRIHPEIWVKETGWPCPLDDKVQILGAMEQSDARAQRIARDVVKAMRAGRNPLVMAERLEVLRKISAWIFEINKEDGKSYTEGWYIGGKSEKEREEAAKGDVVFSTYQLAKEGIDIPRLDTLFVATPCSDPEQACCPPGTLVWIDSVPKPIEEVKVGDFVTTRRAPREVLKIHRNKFTGKLYKFKCNRLLPFRVTGNHEILVKWAEKRDGIVQLSRTEARYKKAEFLFEFMNSNEFLKDRASSKRPCFCIPVIQGNTQHISLNEKRCRLLGYFIAEGSLSRTKRVNKRTEEEREIGKKVDSDCCIAFHFHMNESSYQNEVISILKAEFDVDARLEISEETNTISVKCTSNVVEEFIKTFVTGLQPVRRLSKELMTLRNDWQMIILGTAFLGDGSIGMNGQFRYHSSSPYLVSQFQQFLLRKGIIASVFENKNHQNRFSDGPMYELNVAVTPKNIGWFEQKGTVFWSPVSSCSTEEYDGEVFNLSVDEYHFYSLMGATVHNCGRIVRRKEGKKTPFVVDYIDSNDLCRGLYFRRLKLYNKLGWKVTTIK